MCGEETMSGQGADQASRPGDEAGSHTQRPGDAHGTRAGTSGRSNVAAETRQGHDGDRNARPNKGHPSRTQQAAVRTREIPKLMNGRHGSR
jgi:hypothetical protein